MNRTRGALAALTLLGLAAATRAQPAVAVALPDGGVTFGAPFELWIERSWPRDHAPQPFDALSLLPLEADELGAELVEDGGRLVETRRFLASCWRVGEVELGPFVLRTRDGAGREHVARQETARLTVRSSLPEPPGPVEWPGDVRELRGDAPWLLTLLLAGVVTAALGGLAFRRRRLPAAAAPPPGPTAADLARAEIEALAAPDGRVEEIERFYVALAGIVRRYAEREFGIRALVRTSEELVAGVPRGGDPLRDCLQRCDLVKFAADAPGARQNAEARDRALRFVDGGGGPQ